MSDDLKCCVCNQGHKRGSQEGGKGSGGGEGSGGGGHKVDLAGTRTVKEILRVVNARRMSFEIGRRLSAVTGESGNPHAPTTDGKSSVSTAPAASAGVGGDSATSFAGDVSGINGNTRCYGVLSKPQRSA